MKIEESVAKRTKRDQGSKENNKKNIKEKIHKYDTF